MGKGAYVVEHGSKESTKKGKVGQTIIILCIDFTW